MRLRSISKPITVRARPRKGDGDRQADIAEPDDSDFFANVPPLPPLYAAQAYGFWHKTRGRCNGTRPSMSYQERVRANTKSRGAGIDKSSPIQIKLLIFLDRELQHEIPNNVAARLKAEIAAGIRRELRNRR